MYNIYVQIYLYLYVYKYVCVYIYIYPAWTSHFFDEPNQEETKNTCIYVRTHIHILGCLVIRECTCRVLDKSLSKCMYRLLKEPF